MVDKFVLIVESDEEEKCLGESLNTYRFVIYHCGDWEVVQANSHLKQVHECHMKVCCNDLQEDHAMLYYANVHVE